MFKKLFIGFVLLVIVAAAGVSYYVSTIDWNLHKDKIALQFEQITGKHIVFNGPVSLSFLPKPYLTVKDIAVYNSKTPNQQPLATIAELVSDLSVWSLLKGTFEVDNMSLLNAKIQIEFSPDGKLNWQIDKAAGQDDFAPAFDVAFNSVMLENATVHIVHSKMDLDVTMEKVNAEVSAQSLSGPYRIDGNFIKDNNPAGFALNIGNISESFATSVNLVLTHPISDSYARFDGSVLPNGEEIKGNFTMESQKPSDFINSLTNQVILPVKYNYPVAGSVELSLSNQLLNLSSFIIKYGDNTAGSGSVRIPLGMPLDERPTIDLQFEMTNLDLDPIGAVIAEYLKQYDAGKPYRPYYDYDLNANIQAVKARYRGENLRNLSFNATFQNDILQISELSALLPGDTDTSIQGEIFDTDEVLSYRFDVSTQSQDLLKLLEWIGLKPETYAQATYRNASSRFNLSGNLNQIAISPYEVTFDKSAARGIIGIVRKPSARYFITAESESINFDNYLPPLTDEEKAMSLTQKISHLFDKLSAHKNLDLHLDASLGQGIYNKTSFENVTLKLDAKDGNVQLSDLSVGNILDSKLALSGAIEGIAPTARFKDLKFNAETTNLNNLKQQIGLVLPAWPLFAQNESATFEGVYNGSLQGGQIEAKGKINALEASYNGRLAQSNDRIGFEGKINFKTPDFTQFTKWVNIDYAPQTLTNNIFTFEGNIAGYPQHWVAKNLTAFIGSSRFTGQLDVTFKDAKPLIKADLTTNNFEFNRFIYQNKPASGVVLKRGTARDLFLEKPLYQTTPVSFDAFQKFDLDGTFKAEALNFNTAFMENATAKVQVQDGLIRVTDFTATYQKAPVDLSFELNTKETPVIKGEGSLKNLDIDNLGGSRYGISGALNLNGEFEGTLTSEFAFYNSLKGFALLSLENPLLKGFDLDAIYTDLQKREYSDNLFEMLRDNLQRGQTRFEHIGGRLNFENGDYTFENFQMNNANALVDVSGSGSLRTWDINTLFKLSYPSLQDKIVPIDFKWTGTLSNPNLVIEAQALKEKYDSYWQRLADEKAAAEKARQDQLEADMNAAQARVKAFQERLLTQLMPSLKNFKQKTDIADSINQYNAQEVLLVDAKNRLEMLANKQNQEFGDTEIIEINADLENFEPLFQDVEAKLQQIYISDLKKHVAQDYSQIAQKQAHVQKKAVNYKSTLNAYVIRLNQLESKVDLKKDPLAVNFVQQIEDDVSLIKSDAVAAQEIRNIAKESTDVPTLEQKKEQINTLLKHTLTTFDALNESLKGLFDYVQKLVYVEEYGEVPSDKDLPKWTQRIQIIEEDSSVENPLPEAPVEEQSVEPESEVTPTEELQEENIPADESPAPQEKTPAPAPEVKKLQEIIEYASPVATSGSVSKKTKDSNAEKATPKDENTKRLLRPTSRKSLISGGVIKKK